MRKSRCTSVRNELMEKPRLACGQASAEFLMVLSIIAILVLTFLALSFGRVFDITNQQNSDNARYSAQALAEAADYVYSQGEGAQKSVLIRLPADFSPSLSSIGTPAGSTSTSSNAIRVHVGSSDYTASSQADLVGNFPATAENHMMKVVSHGTYVSITPQLFDISQYSVFISMARGQARNSVIIAYGKDAAGDVPLSVDCGWNYGGAVNLSVSPTALNATQQGSNITISVNAGNSAEGIYSSQIFITAVKNGTTDRMVLPISIDVRS